MPHRIGVVDDDPGVRRSVRRLLRAAGFDAMTFESAEDFLNSPASLQCLILDVQLPGRSGVQLARELDAAGRALPVVFITSHETFLPDPFERPEEVWLRKPFDAADLLAAIRRLTATRSS